MSTTHSRFDQCCIKSSSGCTRRDVRRGAPNFQLCPAPASQQILARHWKYRGYKVSWERQCDQDELKLTSLYETWLYVCSYGEYGILRCLDVGLILEIQRNENAFGHIQNVTTCETSFCGSYPALFRAIWGMSAGCHFVCIVVCRLLFRFLYTDNVGVFVVRYCYRNSDDVNTR